MALLKAKELRDLLRRAAACVDQPGSLTEEERLQLEEDLSWEADEIERNNGWDN